MEKETIIKNLIITLILVVVIAVAVKVTIDNDITNRVLGTWEAVAGDGTIVSYEFTDEYENASTKETLYTLTVTNSDGSTETEKGTYKISNDTIITFRPLDESITDTATADIVIEKDVMKLDYTVDFEEKEIVFNRVK